MGEVLALGSVNIDVQLGADRPPRTGEELHATRFLLSGGGKAANVAVAACRLGAGARVFGRVGSDLLADVALSPLVTGGIDVSGIRSVRGATTGVALVVVTPDGNKAMLLAANANDEWSEDDARDVERALRASGAGAVLVVDLETPRAIVGAAMRAARRAGIEVILDPSPADRVDDGLLALADYVTPNRREAELITSMRVGNGAGAALAGRQLLARGCRTAVVKTDDGGCVVVTPERSFQLHAPAAQVVDKTGAGDAFAGALAASLAEPADLVQASCRAVAAAALAVRRWGAQPSYPTRAELEAILPEVGW